MGGSADKGARGTTLSRRRNIRHLCRECSIGGTARFGDSLNVKQSYNMVGSTEASMRNHIHLIEMLPISAVSRAVARANYDAAEESIDRIVRALA